MSEASSWRLTIEDDEDGDVRVLIDDRYGESSPALPSTLFETLMTMVSRPGNKRTGDAVEIILYRDSVIVDRYKRCANGDQEVEVLRS